MLQTKSLKNVSITPFFQQSPRACLEAADKQFKDLQDLFSRIKKDPLRSMFLTFGMYCTNPDYDDILAVVCDFPHRLEIAPSHLPEDTLIRLEQCTPEREVVTLFTFILNTKELDVYLKRPDCLFEVVSSAGDLVLQTKSTGDLELPGSPKQAGELVVRTTPDSDNEFGQADQEEKTEQIEARGGLGELRYEPLDGINEGQNEDTSEHEKETEA